MWEHKGILSVIIVVAVVAIAVLIVPSVLYPSDERQNIVGQPIKPGSSGGGYGGGSGGNPTACNDECGAEDAAQCFSDTVRMECVNSTKGCLQWLKQQCSSNHICVDGVCEAVQTSNPFRLALEAEDGKRDNYMEQRTDTKAKNGEYLMTPNGVGGKGKVDFTFTVPQQGKYRVWGRVQGETGNDDSFFVLLDGKDRKDWHFGTTGIAWKWVKVTHASQEVVFPLTAGEHTLTIQTREDGSKIDAIVITNEQGFDPRFDEVHEIGLAWAGHPARYSLITQGNMQFIAFYDAQGYLTIASRQLGSNAWNYKKLDTQTGWDAHNYIRMVIDTANQLHVAGNMHVTPLIYYKMATPLDISTLARTGMTGRL